MLFSSYWCWTFLEHPLFLPMEVLNHDGSPGLGRPRPSRDVLQHPPFCVPWLLSYSVVGIGDWWTLLVRFWWLQTFLDAKVLFRWLLCFVCYVCVLFVFRLCLMCGGGTSFPTQPKSKGKRGRALLDGQIYLFFLTIDY